MKMKMKLKMKMKMKMKMKKKKEKKKERKKKPIFHSASFVKVGQNNTERNTIKIIRKGIPLK